MSRTTIDYGIDLGTTNSAVAVVSGTTAEVIKNNDQNDITPSAVFIDKLGKQFVGKKAKDRVESDGENAVAEFKLRMGTKGQAKTFKNSGATMEPEELSAEVLKSLRADVKRRQSEELEAAVVTVPAAFELNQCDATKRAAALAGLRFAPLMLEPTAAAQAYGFQSEADNVFWLVYDFGGGTFDAAVVQVRDGEFSVVNHHGDNYLGGKLIDWEIVEQLFIPALVKEYDLPGFSRNSDKWRPAIAKLKGVAEEAKIAVSSDDSYTILIDAPPLCVDAGGNSVEFQYELQRKDVERLAEPYILRSLNLCRKALQEKRLGPADIEKVLLVGGPTLTPYLRERLADRSEGLGIPLDFSLDPMTVVARGAAIFAGTQRFEGASAVPLQAGQFAVKLEYEPVGADEEPFIGGVVSSAAGSDLAGFTIELVNAEVRPAWRSGQIKLAPTGSFTATLWAEKGRKNWFGIVLTDASGNQRDVTPERFSYTIGMVDTQPPLTHSIGVGLANNEVMWVLEKGTPLPKRNRVFLRTTVEVQQGQGGGMIRIPVVEGEHSRADRNKRIGTLEVNPKQVRRPVPAASEVEVTIDIDASRLVVAKAFVPILDEEFDEAIKLTTETVPEPATLEKEVDVEKKRLAGIRERAAATADSKALALLRRIDDERILPNIDALVASARADTDAATTCASRLLDLRAALDEVDAALEWPDVVAEAEQLIEAAEAIVEAQGNASDKRKLGTYVAEVRDAMKSTDADVLRRRIDELRSLAYEVYNRSGAGDVSYFESLKERRAEMRDQGQADRLINEGDRAINRNDVDALRSVNRQLSSLLPTPPPPTDPFSTVQRG